MKVLIISGFLGAGKTTFIKRLVETTGSDFAILENEYGEIGVDGPLLEEAGAKQDQEINIWELTEGCICCSVNADFGFSVLTIANTVDPEYLIVEPSGVGQLSNVLAAVSKVAYERITILEPVTIIDANCFDADLLQYGELYENQIMYAGRIVLSKIENMDAGSIQTLVDAVRKINPQAQIDAEHYSKKPASWWHALLGEELDKSNVPEATSIETPDMESVAFKEVTMSSIGELALLLESTIRERFGKVKRAKGSVCIGGSPFHFELVSSRYSIEEGHPNTANGIVFIGTDLDEKAIQEALSH